MVKAWFMDDSDADQRLPHQQAPNAEVTSAQLDELGVLQFKLDPFTDNYNPDEDEQLKTIRKERGYAYTDTIIVSPEKLPNYEAKIKIFFEEHLHTDEEIRYCLDGTGYFDVRSKEDKWIRIAVEKGEMIILPAGIYHRFTLNEKNYIKAMRLFVGEPVWTPYNRAADGTDAMAARADYVKRFLEGNEPGAKKSRTEAAAATEETAAA